MQASARCSERVVAWIGGCKLFPDFVIGHGGYDHGIPGCIDAIDDCFVMLETRLQYLHDMGGGGERSIPCGHLKLVLSIDHGAGSCRLHCDI